MKTVSIIIPCYNEEKNIQKLLKAIKEQSFPASDLEVIIADGASADRTRAEIADFALNNQDLKIVVIDNHKKIIPAALNLAIKASSGKYIVRIDAHSIPNRDYVERCVGHLEAQTADNVGGLWLIQPASETFIAKSIAAAAAHPFGVGDAKYRYSDQPAYVETVPYGAYRREIFDDVGHFNETLLANEDYELNTRIIKNGKKIYFDPKIKIQYIARENLQSLWKQYTNYGFWKLKMLKRYPETIRLRQAIPPLFVLSIMFGSIMALFWPLIWYLLAVELLAYFGLLTVSSISIVRAHKDYSMLLGVPMAIMTMHIGWGSGFIYSFLDTFLKRK